MERMDHAPGSFVLEHEASDLAVFDGFVHRTFQAEDARGFVRGLAGLMRQHGSWSVRCSRGGRNLILLKVCRLR